MSMAKAALCHRKASNAQIAKTIDDKLGNLHRVFGLEFRCFDSTAVGIFAERSVPVSYTAAA